MTCIIKNMIWRLQKVTVEITIFIIYFIIRFPLMKIRQILIFLMELGTS